MTKKNRIVEVQDPLVRQSATAELVTSVLIHAAIDLCDAATLDDRAQMFAEARCAAKRVLAICKRE